MVKLKAKISFGNYIWEEYKTKCFVPTLYSEWKN